MKRPAILSAAAAAILASTLCMPANAVAATAAAPALSASTAASAVLNVSTSVAKGSATTTGAANLRTGAGEKHKVIKVLKKGTAVAKTGKSSGKWVQVKAAGKTGWVSSKLLKNVTAKKNSATSSSGYKTTASLNLRAGAGTSHKVIAVLKKGTMVSKTGKTNGKWWQVQTAGKTGWASSAYLTSSSSATQKPNTSVSKPSSAAKIKTSYSQKHAGLTYAIMDGGVDWSKPVGKMMYLDGDFWTRGYSGAVSERPNSSKGKEMAKVAAQSNLVLVIPRIPTYTRGEGYTWWKLSGSNAPKLKSLDAYVDKKIGGSKARTWYMGYSGGAEYITFELAKRGQGGYGYGGAILLGGGGKPDSANNPPADFKKNFDMHWFVGSRDGAGQSSNAMAWSAFNASLKGQKFYKSKGYKTTRTVLPGVNHHGYNLAKIMDQGLRKGGL